MQIYDNIILNKELNELSQSGIHKNYLGTVVGVDGDILSICFFNPHNLGEFAFAKASLHDVSFVARADENIISELKNFLSKTSVSQHQRLAECDVKEYDAVELIVEKSTYAKNGVHKGDRGCVVSTYAINNRWEIIFSEKDTAKDIAQISVCRDDFKIIDKT